MIVTRCPAYVGYHCYLEALPAGTLATTGEMQDYCSKYRKPCAKVEGCSIKNLIEYCQEQDLPNVYEFMGLKENESNN